MIEIARTAVPVGFAVQKDILNHPVREVDRVRHREMWLIVLASVVLLVVVLVTLWQQAEVRQFGIELEKQQKALAAEEAANYHLRVELESLRSLKRIEQLAPQLNLTAPANGDVVVIERVTPSPAPAKGLVARR
ncbi:MAG: cell division protein FtsL [Acidobacteria bacterium]|nr:cell division protein FtsL [Acidobacteriota bacterium]